MNLGYLYFLKGQYEPAVADFTRVIEINPKDFQAYINRGNAYYDQGYFKKAAGDYQKAIEINAEDEYARIWLLLALRKVSKDDYYVYLEEFENYVKSSRSEKWVRTISRYYQWMYGLTESDVLSAAQAGRDKKEVRQRLCEAYYYIGEEMLWKGDRKAAEEFFNKSLETRAYDFREYGSSKAMLRLMKQGKL